MALLQVRNFPDELYEIIRIMAAAERRSVAQQAVLLVERGLNAETPTAGARRRAALERAMNREVPGTLRNADIVAILREDRDR